MVCVHFSHKKYINQKENSFQKKSEKNHDFIQCFPRLPPVWNGEDWAVVPPKGLMICPSRPWLGWPKVDWLPKILVDWLFPPPNGFVWLGLLANMDWLALGMPGTWGVWGTCWGAWALMAAFASANKSFPTNGEGPVAKFEVCPLLDEIFFVG